MTPVKAKISLLVVAAALCSMTVVTSAVPARAASSAAPGAFVPVAPTRILDTRIGLGAPKAPVQGGADVVLQIAGRGGVPWPNVDAVAITVTVTQPTAGGFVSVAPYFQAPTSTFNYGFAQTVSNAAVVRLGGGSIDIRTSEHGTLQILADVTGYVSAVGSNPLTAGAYMTIFPERVLDTRTGVGAPRGRMLSGHTVAVQVNLGVGANWPYAEQAVALNVTVVRPTAAGHLTVYAHGSPRPATSSVNFAAGRTVANLTFPAVSVDGLVDVTLAGGGSADLVADVSGYVLAGSPMAAGSFRTVPPSRLLDTRTGIGAPARPVAGGATVHLQVTGRGAVPAGAQTAVLNVTVVDPTRGGHLTAYADGQSLPLTTNLSFAAGATTAALGLVRIGSDGKVALHVNSSGPVQLLADVVGFTAAATQPRLAWSPGTTSLDARDVSCASSTFCMAVTRTGQSVVFDGTTWSAPLAVGSIPANVRCASNSFCVAAVIGSETAVVYDGSQWSAPKQVSAARGNLDIESCPESGFCLATDSTGLLYIYADGVWSAPENLGIRSTDVTGACASPTSCAIVDSDGDYATYDGQRWSALSNLPSSALFGVSCPADQECFVVGGAAFGDYLVSTLRLDGTRITPIASVYSPQQVDCVGATTCIAAAPEGRTHVYDGYGWSPPIPSGFSEIDRLSCAGTLCVALDDGTARVGTIRG